MKPVKPREKDRLDRFLEKVPPLVGLLFITLPVVLSVVVPHIVAYFIIALNVYFLYKSITYAIQFAISLIRIRHNEQIDWIQKLNGLKNIPKEIEELQVELQKVKTSKYEMIESSNPKAIMYDKKYPMFIRKLFFNVAKAKTINFLKTELKELRSLEGKDVLDWEELNHVVIVPHVKEPFSILKKTMEHLRDQSLPSKYISVVLGAEAADPNGVKVSEELKAEYGKYFKNIWITNHVLGEDEIVGKSSNMAWAGKQAYEEIVKLGWDLKKTTVTSCDADSKLPRDYFAYMTYKFVTIPESEYKFFNGAMVLYNNIWRLPFYARVKNSMSTIYNVGRLVRTDKLVPFSTYTTSYWLIKEVGFWTPWITPEDFHIFFKSLFEFQDKVGAVPLYIKIMSDAAEGEGHFETIKNNYMQERRWSWGISDDGWVLKNLFTRWKNLTLNTKYLSAHVVFDHIMGPVISIIILVGGNIPPLINAEFRRTVFGNNLPEISSLVVQMTLVTFLFVIFLDFFLKPRRENESFFTIIMRLLEWIVQPVSGFILNVLPGLEAHTRLLFGRYLEYYVTKKKDEN